MIPTNTQLLLLEATDLLSREDEAWVFGILNQQKIDVTTLVEIENRTLNENSQLWAARQRVKRTQEDLVKANLPLVIRVAKRFACPEVSEELLVSEGLMKLLQCIAAFKIGLGYKFSTYLQRPLYRHFYRFIQKEAKRNVGRVDGEITFLTRVVEEGIPVVDELMEVLEAGTAGLDAMEKTMILHHYGIGKLSPKTLKELSSHFGLSQGRLKKTLASAIEKLGNVLIERNANVVK